MSLEVSRVERAHFIVHAACDLGTWVGEGADAAVDAGLRFLDATTGLGTEALAGLRTTVEATVSSMRALSSELAAALAHTPAGMLALDVVTIVQFPFVMPTMSPRAKPREPPRAC